MNLTKLNIWKNDRIIDYLLKNPSVSKITAALVLSVSQNKVYKIFRFLTEQKYIYYKLIDNKIVLIDNVNYDITSIRDITIEYLKTARTTDRLGRRSNL